MSKKRLATIILVAGLLGVMCSIVATMKAPSANAAVNALMSTVGMKSGTPAPTCPAPYVFSGVKASCVPCPQGTKFDTPSKKCKVAVTTASGATIFVEASAVDSFNLNMRGTIVADVHLKGTKKNSPKCGVANGYNGYKVVNGKWYYRYEKNVKYCPNPNSPTGYAKVGGGDTGKDCENPFKPGHRSPGPVLKGPITELNSFNVHIPVSAQAHAKVHGQCPNIDVGGDASASGVVKVVITQSLIYKAKGKATALMVLLRESLAGKGVTRAVAQLHLSCNVPTVTQPGTTTPGPTTTATQTVTQPGTTTAVTTTSSTTTTVEVQPPQIRNLTQIQEFSPNGFNPNVCVDTKNVPGGGGTVKFIAVAYTAPAGTFTSGAVQAVQAGSDHKCATLTAPSSLGVFKYYAELWVGSVKVDQTDTLSVEVKNPDSNPS